MNRAASVRTLLVDDHALVRAGLRTCFATDPALEVVGEAACGREALALMASMPIDLVVIDVSMPDMDGFQLITELKQHFPRARVLVLSMHDKPPFVQKARAAGAHGYVSKSAPAAVTLAAAAIVAAGELYFPELSERLPRDPLTAREREVLLLVARGLQNKEIADKLAIGLKTVETHRLHAREKLGLGTAAQCRQYAEEQGWL